MADKGLFRTEAIAAKKEKFLGAAAQARPIPDWAYTLLATAFAIGLVLFAVVGQYQRRERVEGFLDANAGTVPVLIPSAGRVTQVLVAEGDPVVAKQPLAVINADRATSQTASVGQAITEQLEQRRALLERERAQAQSLASQQVNQHRQRIAALVTESEQVAKEVRLQEARLASAQEQSERFAQLAKEKFVSDLVARQKQDEATDQNLRLQSLQRQLLNLTRDLNTARLDTPAVEIRARATQDAIDRQLSELAQQTTQESARQEQAVLAPIDGIATNIGVIAGQSVSAEQPLATLMPRDGLVQAVLLVPSRAIGFVEPGQPVLIRYEAFPHERFGLYEGKVASVSRTVWSTGERIGPVVIKEPVYRVVVKLSSQSARASGKDYPLRPGMMLNADLLMERRTILQWLIDPVMKLGGNI